MSVPSSSSPSTFDVSHVKEYEQRINSNNPNENQVVPVFAEKYLISEKVITQEFIIEKRLVEDIATIKVPIEYEEIYVNGKKFESPKKEEKGEEESVTWQKVLSSIKDAITNKKDNEEEGGGLSDQERVKRKKAELIKSEVVPLTNDGTIEEILPLCAEEIIIDKRIKQLLKQ